MSVRVSRKGLKSAAAIVAMLTAAGSLAGCSTFGMGGDQMTTGSIGNAGSSNLNQPMPGRLSHSTQVADDSFVPPENVGSGPMLQSNGSSGSSSYASLPPSSPSTGSISSQDLPVLGSSNGNSNAMSAQHAAQTPQVPVPVAPAKVATAPALTVVPAGVYTHVIKSGESLYTIAKHYNVTAQAIMQASNISAPDKIVVGQRVVIPGRPDLLAAMDGVKAPAANDMLPLDSAKPTIATAKPEDLSIHSAPPLVAPVTPGNETKVASLGNAGLPPLAGRIATAPGAAPAAVHNAMSGKPPALTPPSSAPAATPHAAPTVANTAAPAAPAAPKPALTDPPVSNADKFRWPLQGKVVIDFAASRGTGINIAAAEGTPIKAVENGTVIYVGSGVEGYGNLILIRHSNGYVSAYADLKDMNVQKGASVNRGDIIGTTGQTGSVKSPQLHFELRKGAAPVDPVPLMAG